MPVLRWDVVAGRFAFFPEDPPFVRQHRSVDNSASIPGSFLVCPAWFGNDADIPRMGGKGKDPLYKKIRPPYDE